VKSSDGNRLSLFASRPILNGVSRVNLPPHFRMSFPRFARVAFVACAVLAVACGDITRQKATYTTALSSFSVFTLTGTPLAEPNALSFLGGVTRATSSFGFDVAFDIDSSGKVVVYPVRSVAGAAAGTPKRVGLQIVPGGFDALREAPLTGYDTVGTQRLSAGTALAVELRDPTACFSYNLVSSQLLYGKLVIDSAFAGTRHIYGRVVIDPNCGYRGLVPDSIPRN